MKIDFDSPDYWNAAADRNEKLAEECRLKITYEQEWLGIYTRQAVNDRAEAKLKEVIHVINVETIEYRGFVAVCPCGWRGEPNISLAIAKSEKNKHLAELKRKIRRAHREG